MVAGHGGSSNKSTLWVSAKTCDGSNQAPDPLEDVRCLAMRGKSNADEIPDRGWEATAGLVAGPPICS